MYVQHINKSNSQKNPFFIDFFVFEFSNFLLLRLEIAGEGSIVRFSFVVEWDGTDLVSSHDSCRSLIFVFFFRGWVLLPFRWQC